MTDRESLHGLAASYALGALDADEAAAFETLLASSPEARAELREYREVVALLGLAAGDATPPASLRARVLREAPRAAAAAAAPAPRAPRAPWLVAAAAVMLAAWGWLGLQSARRDLASATAELAATESTLAASEDARRGLDSVLAGILAPGVQLYQLTASGNPDPVIQLFWDAARRRAVLSGARLPAVAPGRAYQLWFILDGAPVPSVTFEPDAQGRVVVPAVELPGTAAPTAAAITEEPAGGSAQPTTPIILLTTFRQS